MIIDLTMPGKSGLETIADVRRKWPTLPIVLMSGYPSVDKISPDILFLAKPFSPEELTRAMNDLIEASGKQALSASTSSR
jgi:DNA-binding NtrC family response regulator